MKLENQRIVSLIKIYGGINSGADQNGCTDTYTWTTNSNTGGNDHDDKHWYCPIANRRGDGTHN